MAVGKYQPLTLTPVNFSLTEGTSIPAPAQTPPDTPRAPTSGKGPLSSHPTPKSAVFPHHEVTPPNKGSTDSDQTATNDAASTLSPSSPTSRRPSSVRKFLGLRPFSSHDTTPSERPGSPATIGSQPSLRRRKSGSWFGKNKRQSSFIAGSLPEGKESSPVQAAVQPAQPPVKKGPPAPALPDLKSFGVSTDLGADDMFKGIN